MDLIKLTCVRAQNKLGWALVVSQDKHKLNEMKMLEGIVIIPI